MVNSEFHLLLLLLLLLLLYGSVNFNLRPFIEIEGADAGDVRAQIAMDAGAFDADQNSQVEAGPVGI